MPIDPSVMETLVLVLGVLSAGLSAADPPQGLYTAEGVTYVGCFEHGQAHNEQVLEVKSVTCSLSNPEPCLVPATCIDSCRDISTRFVYIGLKYPGECFCDWMLRGVNQTDSVQGIYCDGWCAYDEQLACGSDHMLVYQLIIAAAAAGGAALLIAASVGGVCLWRRKSGQRRDDKQRSSLALQDVSHHCTSHPPSASHSNPTVPPNPSNIDALYAKPDKKRKPKMSSPDEPSYQDVVPTGAQHQYATANDNHPPNSIAQQDANPYDSIQNDPQYAVVNKGRKHRPNVDVNPIYMGGSGEGGDSPNQENTDMLGMVDNVIYE